MFLANIEKGQSKLTAKSYRSDLTGKTGFIPIISKYISPAALIDTLTEEAGAQYMQDLLNLGLSPATRQRHAAALREFFRFVSANQLASVSSDRLKYLLKAGHLLPSADVVISFDEDKVLRIVNHAKAMRPQTLIEYRDKAFVLTLAETGMRVHEACGLKRGAVDWETGKAVIIGKGRKQASVFFADQSLDAVRSYHRARAQMDGESGRPLAELPVFARHDKGAGKKVKPIGPLTGEAIIHAMAQRALGDEYDENITCHQLRHYFVTVVLRATNNLKIAQEMARHKNIGTTQRYAHVLESEKAQTRDLVFNKKKVAFP